MTVVGVSLHDFGMGQTAEFSAVPRMRHATTLSEMSFKKARRDIVSGISREEKVLLLQPAWQMVCQAGRTGGERLERVNQIELLPFQTRLVRSQSGGPTRGEHGVLQIRVESMPDPERVAGDGIRGNLEQSIYTILQDIAGGALVAFGEGCQDRILLNSPPRVADLEFAFVLGLAYAGIDQVSVRLSPQICAYLPVGPDRMPGRA